MDPNLTIPGFGYDSREPSLLPEDGNLEISSDESPPAPLSSSSESEPGSEPKRQKIEEPTGGKSSDEVVTEDDGGTGSEEEEDEDEEEEEEWTQVMNSPVVFYPPDEEGQAKLMRFYDQIVESEGFDFVDFPPVEHIECGVMWVDLKSAWGPRVKDCVDHVIKEHNAAGDRVLKLEAGEVVKANMRSCQGTVFYITFKATDPANHDAEKLYQAEVYRSFDGTCETQLFREKGQQAILELPTRYKLRPDDDPMDCDCDGPCDCRTGVED